MRLNQVSISISRFGEAVPEDYPADHQYISVYSDRNESVFEALSMAYCQSVNAIREYQPVTVRTDVCVNAEGRLYGDLLRRRHADTLDMERYEKRLPMLKDLLYCLENAGQIIEMIRRSPNRAAAAVALQKQLGMTEARARAALRLRFDLFTMEEIKAVRAEIQEAEEVLSGRETRRQATTESTEGEKKTTI